MKSLWKVCILNFFAKDQKGELAAEKKKVDEVTGKKQKGRRGKDKNDKKDKNKSKDWIWTKVKINLKQILEEEDKESDEGRKNYIKEKGVEKFKEFKEKKEDLEEGKTDFFEIPGLWFSG